MSESAMDYEPIKLLYFKALYLDKSSNLSDNLQTMQISNIALPSRPWHILGLFVYSPYSTQFTNRVVVVEILQFFIWNSGDGLRQVVKTTLSV